MNGMDYFNADLNKSMCRVCLKTNNNLYTMSTEHINLYRNIVEKIAQAEYTNYCFICRGMLQKFSRFIHQCQIVNNILKEVHNMDPKSLMYLPELPSTVQITITKLDQFNYLPFGNEYDVRNNHINTTFDIYDNSAKIELNGHDIINDYDNSDCKNEMMNDDTYDGNDNNDEDEIPLVLLMTAKKKKKKRSKHKESKMKHRPIKEELSTKHSTEQNKEGMKKKKELREGFTSRMVQETDEYIVIKLTREQVLQEMAERSKTESYMKSIYRCEKCIKPFNFEDVMQTHMKKHTTENGSFLCDMCDQYCPSAVSLRGHIKSHTTRYKCKLCGHVRLSRQHLLEHHAISHTAAPPTYRCDFCQFTTPKRTVMQRHVRAHSSTESHSCTECGKEFKSIETLRLHIVRHNKSSQYKCNRCPSTFVYRSLLRRHALGVHERRDYYCVECDLQFNSNESLRLHFKKAKRHRDSSANNHQCPQCPSRFYTSSSLETHLCASHCVARQHACPECARSYTSRDAVRVHLWRAHSQRETRASCTRCGDSFTRKSSLKTHVCAENSNMVEDSILQSHIIDKHKKDEDNIKQYDNKIEE